MSKETYTVVWSGSQKRDSLLGDREERWDGRFAGMPSFDLDDGEAVEAAPKRQYNKTGRYKGVCSRTNPLAKQYVPSKKRLNNQALSTGDTDD